MGKLKVEKRRYETRGKEKRDKMRETKDGIRKKKMKTDVMTPNEKSKCKIR